jgi:GTP cyclohydrolase I
MTQETTHDATDGRTDAAIDRAKAQEGARLLLEAIGENPDRPGLEATWRRRVPGALAELSEGLRDAEKPTMRTFDAESDSLVVKTGIPTHSLCEHHLLPFTGELHVAYRPTDRVVGLSKLARYVRWQSRRPTMQERLTTDVATGLAEELGAGAVLAQMTATHLCEAMRGVETPSATTTYATAGEPTPVERDRFRAAIRRGGGDR